MEKYVFLFVDTFFSSSVFSTDEEIAIHIMKIYKEYNQYLIWLLFFLGTFCGLLINYVFGVAIKKVVLSISNNIKNRQKTKEKIINSGLFFDKYWFVISLLSEIDLYSKVVTFFFGFCSSRKFLFAFIFISIIRTLYCYFY